MKMASLTSWSFHLMLSSDFAIIFPVIVTWWSPLPNYDFQHLPPNKLLDWVGLTNFTNIWSLSTFRSAFGAVLSWTIIWALAASTLQIVIGIFTAIIANQPFIKGKRIFGVISFFLGLSQPSSLSWHSQTCLTIVLVLSTLNVIANSWLNSFLSWWCSYSLENRPNLD